MSNITRSEVRRIVRKEVQEQLAEQLAESSPQSHESDADQLAESVMVSADLRRATTEQLSPRETIREQYGLDAADYDTRDALLADVREERR